MNIVVKIFASVFVGVLLSSFSLSTNQTGKPAPTQSGKPAPTQTGKPTPPPAGKTTPPASNQTEKPYIIVGEMPHFPGGKLAMNRFISANLTYPFEAMKHNIQGKVNVEFVVEKDGSLVQIKTVGKKLGFGLEEGAIKIFSSMPKWIPGKQDGKVVPVYMMIPIIYTL